MEVKIIKSKPVTTLNFSPSQLPKTVQADQTESKKKRYLLPKGGGEIGKHNRSPCGVNVGQPHLPGILLSSSND